MDAEKLGRSRFLNLFFKPAGATMESRLRQWLFDPRETLRGADIKSGQTVLEVGCGTGFFTLHAAEIIGPSGHLIAMDPLSDFVDRVKKKVQDAGLKNVEVVRRDALKTELETASVDLVLLFGVVPYPTLPLDRLLPEMHRVLKADGTLAVWLFPVSFGVPTAILRSGLFTKPGKKNGVYTYRRSESRDHSQPKS
ncbi:MAG: class I SAM-dependent methyltransferase [Alphaproteobacteria bacterium]|nr:class I SAM-dependent methyltransferase [Alphaproteobacteria bacterium]MBL6953977.1 class I SAM-dependent methyltransferase [Alphaproteobacteria bacterium]